MKKPFPKFDSDEELEAFLDAADLDEYDLTAGALPRDECSLATSADRPPMSPELEGVRAGSSLSPLRAGPICSMLTC
jgi:hypothetical protein